MDFKSVKEQLIKVYNLLKTQSVSVSKKACYIFRHSRLALFAVSLIIGTLLTVIFSDITFAYKVEYNGAVIAQVKTKDQFSKAVNIAEDMVYEGGIGGTDVSPTFHLTVTTERQLSDLDKVAVGIVEQTDSVSQGNALKIDGEIVACVSAEVCLEDYINNYLAYYLVGDDITSEFVKNVECVEGYYPNSLFGDMTAVEEIILGLDVKSVQEVRSQAVIPYTTVTRKSDSRVLGDVQTVVVGVDGVKEIVESVEMINKTVVSSSVVSEETISKPVQEVIVVGTKKDTSVSAASVSQLGCIWPLKRTSNQLVSAYYGDGRNHKGVDIASPAGTPIYAAQSGTVVFSGYSNGYGYYVIIDHGNGYETLYAHCNKLLVEVGEVVYQGEVIALVGSTGISTGNHLHFEVIKNGVNLNPASFIGL